MADYISREAVKQIIAAQCGECADACLEFDGIQPDCNQCLLGGAAKAIKSIPAADVRPVVTCGECKYWKISKIDPPFHVCTYVCGATFVRSAGDFCSRGEKREES